MVKFTYHCLYMQSNLETHGALISVGQRLPKCVGKVVHVQTADN